MALPSAEDYQLDARKEVTELLSRSAPGDPSVAQNLLPLVYDELRALAVHFMTSRKGQTLQPTALVHEAYLKLVGDPGRRWDGRRHFYEVAAKAMRQVYVDHIRASRSQKRGGGWNRVEAEPAAPGDEQAMSGLDMGGLDAALTALGALNERYARVVELRFFTGLGVEEVGEILGVSPRTVEQDWKISKAFLRRALSGSVE